MEIVAKGLLPDNVCLSQQCIKYLEMSTKELIEALHTEYGFRALERASYTMTTDEFLKVLAKLMKDKEMEIWADVYFDVYNNSEHEVPCQLYLCGYGQHLDQTELITQGRMLDLCRHLTEFDRPYFNTEINTFMPVLKHNPFIEFKMRENFAFSDNPRKHLGDPNTPKEEIFMSHLCCAYSCNIQGRYFEAWCYSLAA